MENDEYKLTYRIYTCNCSEDYTVFIFEMKKELYDKIILTNINMTSFIQIKTQFRFCKKLLILKL